MIFTPNIVYGSYAISIEKKNSVHELSMEKRKKKKRDDFQNEKSRRIPVLFARYS